jgi:hypothetical protein
MRHRIFSKGVIATLVLAAVARASAADKIDFEKDV